MKIQDTSLFRTRAYIDGAWLDSNNGETYDVTNPATNEVLAQVASCGKDETRTAIDAAAIAQKSWAAVPAKKKSALLRAWYQLVVEHQEDLAQILTAEQGKPLAEARGEVAYGANFIDWFAEEAKRIYGDTIAPPSSDKRLICIKQPVGVVACITPWNFPNAMLARKIAPALAAGCTVVCKPANLTPLSAFALAELAERAGIPAGVINMLSGRTAEIGAELTSNPLVRKLTFTGSTPVGKKLMADCAQTMKRISMELGGNAPFIVFDDADIDAAVAGAMVSKFRNAGQTCVCSNRLFIQEGVYDEFVAKFLAAAAELKIGNGIDDDVAIGPLIDQSAADKVKSIVAEALGKGAKLELGSNDNNSTFFAPTVLTNVSDDMQVFSQEIFGPVAPIFKFKDEQEVIQRANDTEVGLACYFYARDIGRIWRVAEALEYGMVGINEGLISNEMAPFGGVKESGQGREGSKYGMDDYLEIKYMCMGGIDQ